VTTSIKRLPEAFQTADGRIHETDAAASHWAAVLAATDALMPAFKKMPAGYPELAEWRARELAEVLVDAGLGFVSEVPK
jgi:hypothetical protein